MISVDELTVRREVISQSPDLTALLARLEARAQPVLKELPPVPNIKALLSRTGGICPEDGATLLFDPWSPHSHRCGRCGRTFTGERHDGSWARWQHLWLAERAAHLAALHAFAGTPGAEARARELLAAYHRRYFELQNKDNVLGPSHLFFSTYLESIWILNYLSAAHLLRCSGALGEEEEQAVNAIADEAATLIGEFNEGMSNRQTWNSAALTAIGVWFEDGELTGNAIESRTGLLGHLTDGFGSDGMWYEGENYHLFAVRGLLLGLHWAATAGAALMEDPALAEQLGGALLAPAVTALPDLTFPARKDSRFGVPLAHPAYLECWEAGHAMLGEASEEVAGWLQTLYGVPARPELPYDSWLHESGETIGANRRRTDLSWWALLTMTPALSSPPSRPILSSYLRSQGLGLIRRDDTYLSLECTGGGGGHGHPDRLHLTLHANGVHWLPDPGTGSYVSRDLFWYRSTLAHNAPRLDGANQRNAGSAHCIAFDAKGDWNWVVAEWEGIKRTVILGPEWIIDLVEMETADPHFLEVPWHFAGNLQVKAAGDWQRVDSLDEFVKDVAELIPAEESPIPASATHAGRSLQVQFAGDGVLRRAIGPGLPGLAEPAPFLIRRAEGRLVRMVTLLDLAGNVVNLNLDGKLVKIDDTKLHLGALDVAIERDGKRITLGGSRPIQTPPRRILADRPMVTTAHAVWVNGRPALDGSLEGFDRSSPVTLDDEVNYFRSEEPYPGPETLSATALLNWDDQAFYLAVDVVKPDLVVRPETPIPLLLDNEPDDLNADGIQVYLQFEGEAPLGVLIRPGVDAAIIARRIAAGETSAPTISGAWRRTAGGYRITCAIHCAQLKEVHVHSQVRFNFLVNEMHSDRSRRSGQLVWSGGPGWVYLRGDRDDPAQFGVVELV